MAQIEVRDNQIVLSKLPPEHPTLKLIWFIGYFFGLELFGKTYACEASWSKQIGETIYLEIGYRTIRHPLDQDYFKNYF